MELYTVKGFQIEIVREAAFDLIGFTRFVKLDGSAIGNFLRELKENGGMDRLAHTADDMQPVWVCLSGNERRADADCRCTVCVKQAALPGAAEGELRIPCMPTRPLGLSSE